MIHFELCSRATTEFKVLCTFSPSSDTQGVQISAIPIEVSYEKLIILIIELSLGIYNTFRLQLLVAWRLLFGEMHELMGAGE